LLRTPFNPTHANPPRCHLPYHRWDYFFYIVYLKSKDESDYTGAEQFVMTCIEEENADWIPTGATLWMTHVDEEDDASQKLQEEFTDFKLAMGATLQGIGAKLGVVTDQMTLLQKGQLEVKKIVEPTKKKK
jgi:hypothetical protein